MKKENSSHYKRSKKLKALRFGQIYIKCNRYHRSMLRSL